LQIQEEIVVFPLLLLLQEAAAAERTEKMEIPEVLVVAVVMDRDHLELVFLDKDFLVDQEE
jgi:hypothetical protein